MRDVFEAGFDVYCRMVCTVTFKSVSDVNQAKSLHNLRNGDKKVAKVAVDGERKVPVEMLEMRCAE